MLVPLPLIQTPTPPPMPTKAEVVREENWNKERMRYHHAVRILAEQRKEWRLKSFWRF